jgi:hypothetical protein
MNVFHEVGDSAVGQQPRASTKTSASPSRVNAAKQASLHNAVGAGARAKAHVEDSTRWSSPTTTALAVEPIDPLIFSTHAWEPMPPLALREILKTHVTATSTTKTNVSFPLGGVVVDATLPAGRRLTAKALVVFDFFFPCDLGLNALYITKPAAQEYTASANTGCVSLGMTRQPLHANQCVFRATVEDNGRGDSDSRLGHLTIHAAVAKSLAGRSTCS